MNITFLAKICRNTVLLTALSAFALAQDQTINGSLSVVGKTFDLNGRRTHVLNSLSGNTPNPGVDSYRYEIARLCVNTYHWQATGPIEVELRQSYMGTGGFLRFAVTAGYNEPSGSVTLLEKFGSALYANVSLGTPVATETSLGGYPNQYIPVYVDLGNYTYWHVQMTHGWAVVSDDVPTDPGTLKFFANPSPTTLSGYVASPGGAARLESRELFAGRIGVGTISPTTSLDVNGSLLVSGGPATAGTFSVKAVGADGADRDIFLAGAAGLSNGFTVQRINNEMRYVFNHGKVGIGTTSPQGFLHSGGEQGVVLSNGVASWINTAVIKTYWYSGIGDTTDIMVPSAGANSALLRLTSAGNVGIGTTNPSHKLAVNGAIRAKEVIVDTGWADYVFADDYRLAPLAEVEAHIKEKKHLPGIPSAAEVGAGGVSLGDMQAKLLAKVEEVTLHLIRLEKENAVQFSRLEKLEQENRELRRQLSSEARNP